MSSVLNEPNNRIKLDYWKDEYIGKLPYDRGFIFAIYLDNKIKANNSNNYLDKFMLDLFKNSKQKISLKIILKILLRAIYQKALIKNFFFYIDQGKTIELGKLMKVLPIKKIKIRVYERGFDRDALLNEKIIKNINRSSSAYKAGYAMASK